MRVKQRVAQVRLRPLILVSCICKLRSPRTGPYVADNTGISGVCLQRENAEDTRVENEEGDCREAAGSSLGRSSSPSSVDESSETLCKVIDTAQAGDRDEKRGNYWQLAVNYKMHTAWSVIHDSHQIVSPAFASLSESEVNDRRTG